MDPSKKIMDPSKKIIGYVISHTGRRGGPWESKEGELGTPTRRRKQRLRVGRALAEDWLRIVCERYPNAKVLPVVRVPNRKRKVVSDAIAFVAALQQSQSPLPLQTKMVKQHLARLEESCEAFVKAECARYQRLPRLKR